MRTAAEVDRVLALVTSGLDDCEVSRRTGVPRRTVLDWRHGRTPRAYRAEAPACPACGWPIHDFSRLPPPQYAYLLGMYLGDGHIAKTRRQVYRLRIYCDMAYPDILDEVHSAIGAVLPQNKVGIRYRHSGGRVAEVYSHSRQWPCLFPQHGPGRKHNRRIALEPWQHDIVRREPRDFLRGLIHSDGCRHINRVRGARTTYAYTRYTFSNASADIRRLFCETCEMLGIEWTQMSARIVSVARRSSVAALDEFVGPKS